jgi:misacylated tRNA(Ala) deacylase
MSEIMTDAVFKDDAYARDCAAQIAGINDRGGIILDKTVFYATGGGQPGDSGTLEIEGRGTIEIATTVYDQDGETVIHVPSAPVSGIDPGTPVKAALDWDRRHGHMRVHTCLHLLCALLPYPVTGGSISVDTGRLDFDIADAGLVDKVELTGRLNELIGQDHQVAERWITDDELQAQPDLVRTMAVKPPMGTGRVRLVEIGGGEVDLQPCGGTHVRSTGEIGSVEVRKIEKKGAKNRRVRVALI